ncbi:hypothetical protein [Rhizobium leguminosarum]|uniref:hypothetical protein n=1 Tax=Rhizobium leguminosarum TaxID=384 RepID=UPI000372FAB0|nr:hypothetical protein [Rhizobium leguminosarum]
MDAERDQIATTADHPCPAARAPISSPMKNISVPADSSVIAAANLELASARALVSPTTVQN